MINIIIAGIEMPRTRSLEVGGEIVAVEAQMASGNLVRDVIGWRTVLTASWDWLPQDTLAAVVAAARGGGYIEITYPDPSGSDITADFKIEIGTQKTFKFVDGAPMWYGVQLTATAREVVDYAGSQS